MSSGKLICLSFRSSKEKEKATPCPHPFNSSLPPVDFEDKNTINQIHNYYLVTVAIVTELKLN